MASYQEIFLRMTFLLFVTFSLTLGSNGVEGRKSIRNSKDLEFERLLKILNKPAEKIIQTKEGDVFNCVDINKQPTFNHPLLKNHTIQVKPSSFPKGMKNGASSLIKPLMDSFKKEGCAPGTVPIRKIQREDLIRAKSLPNRFNRNENLLSSSPSGYHFATIKMEGDASKKYYGTFSYMSVYNPKVSVNQFTEGVIWVQNGQNDQLNCIQIGWTVHPKLFKDNHTRLFAYWTVDGSRRTGCYNTFCPGFVQVSRKISLGQVLEPVSTFGGPQYITDFLIFQDLKTGNWWFVGENKEPVGYWPKSIFTSLANSTVDISWGGEVYNPLKEVMPPMGSGHFISKDFNKTAYIRGIQVVDETFKLVKPDESRMRIIEDNSNCYKVEYYGFRDTKGYVMVYGGPRELSCNG